MDFVDFFENIWFPVGTKAGSGDRSVTFILSEGKFKFGTRNAR